MVKISRQENNKVIHIRVEVVSKITAQVSFWFKAILASSFVNTETSIIKCEVLRRNTASKYTRLGYQKVNRLGLKNKTPILLSIT